MARTGTKESRLQRSNFPFHGCTRESCKKREEMRLREIQNTGREKRERERGREKTEAERDINTHRYRRFNLDIARKVLQWSWSYTGTWTNDWESTTSPDQTGKLNPMHLKLQTCKAPLDKTTHFRVYFSASYNTQHNAVLMDEGSVTNVVERNECIRPREGFVGLEMKSLGSLVYSDPFDAHCTRSHPPWSHTLAESDEKWNRQQGKS